MNFEMKNISIPGGNSAATTNDISTVFQQTTRCPICLMKYNNPRRLHCDHSFCRNCLQGELDRQKQNNNLSCVICQEPITLPVNGGVDQLDGVLIIHDIVQFYHGTSPQPKIQCSKCQGAYCSSCVNLVCNRCDKYISTEFCTDCFEGFCSRCAEEHEKTTGDHILVDVDQAHEMIKDTSENGDQKEGEKNFVEEKREKDGKEPTEEERADSEKGDSDESELDFVYDVSGVNEDDMNGSRSEIAGTMHSNNEDMDDGEGGGLQLISHHENTMHSNDEEERQEYSQEGLQLLSHCTIDNEEFQQTEVVEDYSTDSSSMDSDQSGLNVVLNITGGDDSVSDNEEDNSSLTSSQSGVAMTYDINPAYDKVNDEGSQRDDNEHTPPIKPLSDHPQCDHTPPNPTPPDHTLPNHTLPNPTPPDHTPPNPTPPDHTPPNPTPPDHTPTENRLTKKRVRITEEAPQTSPAHHYEDLQEMVNATVKVHISPEEADRLLSSAPQSEKRRRVARIRPDTTHEPKLPDKYYEIKSLKWCSRITIGFVVVLTICTLAFAGLSLTAYLLTSQDISSHVFQGYNVLIDQPQPFWTRSMAIRTSGAYDSTYHYQTEIFQMECDDLVKQEINYVVNTSGTQPNGQVDVTVEIPTAPNGGNIYLASGSSMTFSVAVWSDYTHQPCSSELNIYDNYDEYISDEGLEAVYSNCIDIGRSSTVAPTVLTYTVDRPSFYFVTLNVLSEDSYSVTVTIDGENYAQINDIYINKCTITSSETSLSDECDFNDLIPSSVAWDLKSYCMVAETRQLAASSLESSFVRLSISYSPNIFRNFAYITILIPLPVYFLACLLAWVCFKGCNVIYVKCRNMHYTHEYQVTEI